MLRLTGMSRFALFLLITTHAGVVLAGYLAPYDPVEQHRAFPYAPPTPIHIFDPEHRSFHWPFVYRTVSTPLGTSGYTEDRSVAFPIRIFVSGASYRLFGIVNTHIHLFATTPPAELFLCGTDAFGRDVFSRLLFGGRISLACGLVGACVAITLAVLFGALAGFFAGWTDEFIMRLAEVFLALPWLYLLFAARAFLPLNVSSIGVLFVLISVLGIIGWARPARLVRGIVLSAKEREYVQAARGFGASNLYLLRVHILPEVAGVALTQAAILIPQYILAEVTLSFLGLGIGEPEPSWGLMLSDLRNYEVLTACWWMFTPALALVLVLFAYYSLLSKMSIRPAFS